MAPSEQGEPLTSEIKSFKRELKRVNFDQDIDKVNVLSDSFKYFLKKSFPNNSKYASYQLRGFKEILDLLKQKKDKCAVISAPTASGKSMVFLAPIIFNALNKGGNAILIFPRLSLMEDQLKNILQIWTNLNNDKLSIGIQRSGIGSNDYITIKYGTGGENPFFNAMRRNDFNGISMRNIKCPICGGQIWAPTEKNIIGKFMCTNANCKLKNADIYVSKDSIIKNKPKLLITTNDSLNSLLFRRGFKDYLLTCDAIAFDEAHAYESLNGAHASNFIKKIMLLNPKLKIILASATIPNPKEFAAKLTEESSNNIHEISPNDSTEIDHSAEENYRIISSDDDKRFGTASLFLQLLMMLNHSISVETSPHREKILSFLDSRDLVNRFFLDLQDADIVKKLPDFRIEKQKYLNSDFYECPQGGEINCDLKVCSLPGKPYYNGECWFGLTKSYFQNKTQPMKRAIRISRAMSGYSDSLFDADLIMSTSYMELGVDDKTISTIVQYKAPQSIYSFIQRKGRAGRDRSKNSVDIWLVAGKETTDRFYYNNLDLLLDQSYHIPLNPNNSYAVWVSRALQFISEKMEEEIINWIKQGENEDDFALEYTSIVNVMNKYFFPNNFKKRLESNGVNSNSLITKTKKELFKKQLKKAQDDNSDDLSTLSKDNEDIFDSIAQKCSLTKNPSECLQLVEALEDSLQNNDEERYKEMNKKIMVLFVDEMYDPTHNEDVSKIMKLLIKVPNLINLKYAVQRNKSIVYENKAIEEYMESFHYWDPFYAAVHLMRSVFYWIIAHPEDRSQIGYEGGIPYLMPTNFFSVGDNISVKIGGNSVRDANFHDFIFRFLPHRMTYYSADDRGEKSRLTSRLTLRYIVKNKTYIEGKGTTLVVTTKRVIGNERKNSFKGRTIEYLEPSALNLEEVVTSSENNEVKYCNRCFNIFGDDIDTCPYDREKLELGRVFSRALFNYKLGEPSKNLPGRSIFGLNIVYYNLLQVLEGENLKITPKDFKVKRVTLSFDPPFGKEFSELPVIEFKVKEPKNAILERIKNIAISKDRESQWMEDYLHSIAHLCVKLVSFISGVSTEYLTYYIDSIESKVQVFEMSENDTGIADSFYESITSDPYNLANSLLMLSKCMSHASDMELDIKADNKPPSVTLDSRIAARKNNLSALNLQEDEILEAIKHYRNWLSNPTKQAKNDVLNTKYSDRIISCFDGCPDCIHLNNCHDRDDQENSISRVYMEIYVESLFREIGINNFKEGQFEEQLLKKEGLIYERRKINLIWFNF